MNLRNQRTEGLFIIKKHIIYKLMYKLKKTHFMVNYRISILLQVEGFANFFPAGPFNEDN